MAKASEMTYELYDFESPLLYSAPTAKSQRARSISVKPYSLALGKSSLGRSLLHHPSTRMQNCFPSVSGVLGPGEEVSIAGLCSVLTSQALTDEFLEARSMRVSMHNSRQDAASPGTEILAYVLNNWPDVMLSQRMPLQCLLSTN